MASITENCNIWSLQSYGQNTLPESNRAGHINQTDGFLFEVYPDGTADQRCINVLTVKNTRGTCERSSVCRICLPVDYRHSSLIRV